MRVTPPPLFLRKSGWMGKLDTFSAILLRFFLPKFWILTQFLGILRGQKTTFENNTFGVEIIGESISYIVRDKIIWEICKFGDFGKRFLRAKIG